MFSCMLVKIPAVYGYFDIVLLDGFIVAHNCRTLVYVGAIYTRTSFTVYDNCCWSNPTIERLTCCAGLNVSVVRVFCLLVGL